MNPNSEHQIWSRWVFTVTSRRKARGPYQVKGPQRSFGEIEQNCARFGRKAFGAATEMLVQNRIEGTKVVHTIQFRTEGHPVHDPSYVAYMLTNFTRFFVAGFGPGTEVKLDTRLEAGSRQDGKPSDQLIMLPPLAVGGL